MDHDIPASYSDLHRQSLMSAEARLEVAIRVIDDRLGSGYAKTHPELIAAFMGSATADQNYAALAKALSGALDDLVRTLSSR
jgi:hypothetical protein